MSESKILFVDDEPEWCGLYLEALGAGFDVVLKHSAAEAIEHVHNHMDIEGIILDIMMPTPIGISSSKTNRGLDTGVWLVEQLVDYILVHKCPVIIATNREKSNFEARLSKLALPPELLQVKMKNDLKPSILAVMMKQLIRSVH